MEKIPATINFKSFGFQLHPSALVTPRAKRLDCLLGESQRGFTEHGVDAIAGLDQFGEELRPTGVLFT